MLCRRASTFLFGPRFYSTNLKNSNIKTQKYPIFVGCGLGIQSLALTELIQHKLTSNDKSTIEQGGIEFRGTLKDIYRCNLLLRTANRILVRIADFQCLSLNQLLSKSSKLPWSDFIKSGCPIAIRVTCKQSRILHTGKVVEHLHQAIAENLGISPTLVKLQDIEHRKETDPFVQLLVVRISNDQCTINIDSSGLPLYKRGYRQSITKAPLRENLASAMILLSEWDQVSPLIDPFCGSGTIPIEASLIASKVPPGINRNFAFMEWPIFNKLTWKQIKIEYKPIQSISDPYLEGSDRDAGAIAIAQENSMRANPDYKIIFTHKSMSDLRPPQNQSGWIISNLPYGVRIEAKEIENLFVKLRKVLDRECRGWRFLFMCGEDSVQKMRSSGFDVTEVLRLDNGGIPVSLIKGKLN